MARMRRILAPLALALMFVQFACAAERKPPAPAPAIPPHPRLLATPKDWDRVRTLMSEGGAAQHWSSGVLEDAKKVLAQPPVKYDAPKGIENAREVLKRITHLAAAHHLTGDRAFARRAV